MSTVEIHHTDTATQAVTLTKTALEHIKKHILKRGSGIGIRLGVKTTGCSGLSYVVDYVDESQEGDEIFKIDDLISIFVDKKSFPYVKGTEIDYKKEGINEKFTFKNPNEAGACGCGESFTVEEK